MELTPDQIAFVRHPGEVFLEACPGAGKTWAILARTVAVSQALPPRHGVALLSFTNKAVDELVARVPSECQQDLVFPGFIGTVDSFVRSFLFAPYHNSHPGRVPQVVDSWDAVDDVAVRLSAPDNFGQGASLEAFNSLSGRVSIAQVAPTMRNHVEAHREQYEAAARRLRTRLHRSNRYSASDVRAIALSRLETEDGPSALGEALAARFKHVIVDEAQDCNRQDLLLFAWLRRHGVLVTMVGDLDQSIFDFRDSSPSEIRAFAATYAAGDRQRLTGNFRSAPAICSLAASLRSIKVPDRAVGVYSTSDTPVFLYIYQLRPSIAVGRRFLAHAESLGIDRRNAIVLAHKESVARQVAGGLAAASGNSRLERFALAVAAIHGASSASEKTRAISAVEHLVLQFQGRIESGESVRSATSRLGLNARLLRRQAFDWVFRMQATCDTEEASLESWLRSAQAGLEGLRVESPEQTSARRWLTRPNHDKWSRVLITSAREQSLAHSTVHSAKGGEYDAVCVVIPPDDQSERTTRLCRAWRDDLDDEARRVLYVAATRARRVVVVAVPHSFRAACETALRTFNVPYALLDP